MGIKLEGHKKNPLLNREEAWLEVEHQGKATPKRADLLEEASKAMKADKENIIVDRITGSDGKGMSRARVFAYAKKEDIPAAKAERIKRRMGLAKKEGEATA